MIKVKLQYCDEIWLVSVKQHQLYDELLAKAQQMSGGMFSTPTLQYRDKDAQDEIFTIVAGSDLEKCLIKHKKGSIPKLWVIVSSRPSFCTLLKAWAACCKQLNRMSRITWFLLLISLWLFLLTIVVVFNGQNGMSQGDISYFFLPYDYDTHWNSTEDFLNLMPDSRIKERMKSCISCHTPEIYNQGCIASLEEPAPSAFSGKTRRDILEEARKPGSNNGTYPPIVGYFNVVLDAESWLFPWIYGDYVALIQLRTLAESGLLDRASLIIRLGLTYTRRTSEEQKRKTRRVFKEQVEQITKGVKKPVKVTYWDPSLYECDTINTLKANCKSPSMQNALVFYLHNKGKSRETNGWEYVNVRHWREYMMFFLFERSELCINTLSKGIPTCGVDLKTDSRGINPHYSGNFWWARCDWVKIKNVVCPLGRKKRSDAEFWVLRDPTGNFRNGSRKADRFNEAVRIRKMAMPLWTTETDHYHGQMPRAEYSCSDTVQFPT